MDTRAKQPSKRRPKPRRWSWHIYRRLKFANDIDMPLITRGFFKATYAMAPESYLAGERIYLPEELYRPLLSVLERVYLPSDRMERWCTHGDRDRGQVRRALEECGIPDEVAEKVQDALLAIELYPSMRPIDRYQIEKVLFEVGDIWPEGRRADNDRRDQVGSKP